MNTPQLDNESILQITHSVIGIAHKVGKSVMEIYNGGDFEVKIKSDNSPVTLADKISEKIIIKELKNIAPNFTIISEEAAANYTPDNISQYFFLVDPIDGTKEFISKTGEFTINIALINNNMPIIGVVYAPAINRIFWANSVEGAFMADLNTEDFVGNIVGKPIKVRLYPNDGITVLASRHHRDERIESFLNQFKVNEIKSAGSSLKFCLIAAGEADLYPRFGRTMEWDTAAGHCILLNAGGSVIRETGEILTYGKIERGFDNPFFIAKGLV